MEVFDPPGTYVTDLPLPRTKAKDLYMLAPHEIPLGEGTDRIKVGAPILPDGVSALVDHVRDNAVDVVQLRRRRWLVVVLVAAVLVAVAASAIF